MARAGTERFGTRADTAAFVACLALSLGALALPESLSSPLASGIREAVLAPFLALQREVVRFAEHRERLDGLRAERDSLALATSRLRETEAENERLRALLGLGARIGVGFVAGEVLHQAGVSDGQTLVLGLGRREGVRPLAPVVTPEGLVGTVLTVDERTSVALAWTHPEFRASAMVDESRIYGIVAARRGARAGEVMELRGIPYRSEVPEGTVVVTSGLGGVFPRGIPIGTVQGVLSESAGWERTYLLRPAVHPASITHVMVLLTHEPGADMRPRFADTLGDTAVVSPRRPGPGVP